MRRKKQTLGKLINNEKKKIHSQLFKKRRLLGKQRRKYRYNGDPVDVGFRSTFFSRKPKCQGVIK